MPGVLVALAAVMLFAALPLWAAVSALGVFVLVLAGRAVLVALEEAQLRREVMRRAARTDRPAGHAPDAFGDLPDVS